VPVHIHVGKEDGHRTICGAILSVFMIIISIVMVFFFATDLILREYPKVIKTETRIIDPDFFNLTPREFPFSLYLSDQSDKTIYDPTIFTVIFRVSETKKIINQ
jgi:hypothetical protein